MPDLNPYRAKDRLGEGGTGRVYLAERPGSGSEVAVKILHSEFVEQREAVVSFLQLARSVGAIEHPNIVKVIDAGYLKNGRAFVAMEFLKGRDLGDVLAEARALDYGRVADIARQACTALQAAHGAGFVHLDIKPNNIFLVQGRNEVKLLDFGIVKLKPPPARDQAAFSQDDVPLGTPEYWSPEQACGQEVDRRSDLYSLGVVMYEALCGRTPFRSHSYSDIIAQHIHCEPALLVQPENRPPIPESLRRIVLRCLMKDPQERFRDAKELYAAIEKVEKVEKVPGSSRLLRCPERENREVRKPEGRSAARRSWRQLILMAALTLVLLGGGFLLGVLVATLPTRPSASEALPEPKAAPVQARAFAGPRKVDRSTPVHAQSPRLARPGVQKE